MFAAFTAAKEAVVGEEPSSAVDDDIDEDDGALGADSAGVCVSEDDVTMSGDGPP